jgi:hypothetical protein
LLGQQQEQVDFKFRGGIVYGDAISTLDPCAFNFDVARRTPGHDTLKMALYHHLGDRWFSSIRFRLTDRIDSMTVGFAENVKAGDGLKFYVYEGEKIVMQRDFYIESTIHSLKKPYYYDVYFLYNEDTVAVEQYILGTRMKLERHHNFKRIFFDDRSEISRSFEVLKKGYLTAFEIPQYTIYHGKVTVQFFDKQTLIEKYGFEQSVQVVDLDGRSGTVGWESRTGVVTLPRK